MYLPHTSNEADVILEPCVVDKKLAQDTFTKYMVNTSTSTLDQLLTLEFVSCLLFSS